MVGPVLYTEMLLGMRRGRQHVFRWVYAAWLVAELLLFYFVYRVEFSSPFSPVDPTATSRFAASFMERFVVQQLIILLLVTPAFAAGAITEEKTRGTLQYLIAADLGPAEIVGGKLLARSAQVGILALTGLPVLCFVGVFGGLSPLLLVVVLAVTALTVLALGSATLLASVWCRQTRDAVLALYAVGALGFVAIAWQPGVVEWFDPLYVLQPAWGEADLPELVRRLGHAVTAWGSIGLVCLALAVWRLRPAYLHQLEGAGRRKKEHWWRPARRVVGAEPILWKERHVDGLAPTAALRHFPGWLGMLAVFAATVTTSGLILWANLDPHATAGDLIGLFFTLQWDQLAALFDPADDGFWAQGVAVMLIASLVVGIRCSGAVSGERERQTWEALLLTPLETHQIVKGKLRGIFGASLRYLLAYAVPAVLLALLGGALALLWTVLWLAVTLLAMYFVGAAGIYCSVRSKSSWRSLLGTLGLGYAGGFCIFVVTSPVIAILALVVYVFLMIVDDLYGIGLTRRVGGFATFANAVSIASCLVLAGAFFGAAWYFTKDAVKRVADRERTRHWENEVVYYRPRRRRIPVRPRPG